jgi:predicted transcriptional regulator
MTESELKFARIVWDNSPINSTGLVRLCEQELNWKKSTTYTVLKKLCEHNIFKNENATVLVLITEEKYNLLQGEKFIEDSFGGSLPRFLTAFITGKKLSKKQIDEIQALINKHRED